MNVTDWTKTENIEKYVLGTREDGRPRSVVDIYFDRKGKKKKKKETKDDADYSLYSTIVKSKKKKKKKKKKNKKKLW
nr:MAG TPA: hypothetical protein [Caudoviricetes sp.]